MVCLRLPLAALEVDSRVTSRTVDGFEGPDNPGDGLSSLLEGVPNGETSFVVPSIVPCVSLPNCGGGILGLAGILGFSDRFTTGAIEDVRRGN